VIAARWTFALASLAFGAAILGGCSETMPLAQLPDLAKLPQKVLSKDEQQGKVNEMIEKSQRHQAEAAKEIEKGR
jgi:hypothetical protein